MSFILLQTPLGPSEIRDLRNEFPEYGIILQKPSTPLSDEEWATIEILYGNHLSPHDLDQANRLRWIHVPHTQTTNLPRATIEKTKNLIVTNTKDPNVHPTAEFVFAGVLAFAKNLFEWKSHSYNFDNPYKSLMWTLPGKTFLQVGLGPTGSQIVSHAKHLKMKTWGVHTPPSYHPDCEKVFPPDELHSLLSVTDILSITMPRGERSRIFFEEEQLRLLKKDSILILIGSEGALDKQALLTLAQEGHFRGILIDATDEKSYPQDSPFFSLPQVLFTPCVASLPEESARLGFSQFIFNFRRYLRNDFIGMKNLVIR